VRGVWSHEKKGARPMTVAGTNRAHRV
jgi:hypothetical protein